MIPATRNFVKNLIDNDDSASLSFILMGITIITKLLGLFYQILTVNRLGINSVDKALFDTASVLPDMLSNILLIGSISAAVIPVLSFVRSHKGEQKYYETFVDGLKVFLLIFIIIAIIVVIFADPIMRLVLQLALVKESSLNDAFLFTELVFMVRLLILPQIILGVSAFFIAGLQSLKKFIIPQLTGLTYNLGQIFGILVLYPLGVRALWAIVIGTFLATILHLIVQIPLIKNTGFWTTLKARFFELSFLKADEDGYIPSWQMIRLAVPRIISNGLEIIMNKYFFLYALTFGITSQQRYYYASSLMMIPYSMFVQSYAVIAFPQMTKAYTDNDFDGFRDIFIATVNKILFYVVPLTVIFLVMRLSVVRLTFGLYPSASKFEWSDTLGIAYILFFFSIGLIPEVINTVMSKVFFAGHNSRIPFITNILLIIFSLIFSFYLTNYFLGMQTLNISEVIFKSFISQEITTSIPEGSAAIGGIALGISFASYLIFIINSYLINKKYFKLTLSDYWITILNKLAAGAVMALTMYLTAKLWEFNVETSTVWGLAVSTGTSILIGLFAYITASIFLKVEEAYYLKSKIKSILYI